MTEFCNHTQILCLTASSDSHLHPPMSLVFFFQSSSSPAVLTSLLTRSSHLSIGLPRLLLPCSRHSAALFGSLSSAILYTCPAHCSLLLTSLSVKLLCTPVSSLNSTILLLSALVTLAIFRTQLFSHTGEREKTHRLHSSSTDNIYHSTNSFVTAAR